MPNKQSVREVLAEIAQRIEKLEEENARLRDVAKTMSESLKLAAEHIRVPSSFDDTREYEAREAEKVAEIGR